MKHYISITFLFVLSQVLYADPTVYIPLGTGNQVIAVDAETDTITASYSNVINAHGLVATPDGEYLIAGSLKEDAVKSEQSNVTTNSNLFIIHPGHGHVMSTIPVSGWSHHQAITPDGKYVLSTHAMRGNVSVLDLEENKITKIINSGKVPNYTLISRDGTKAYVSNTGDNSISEIDIHSWNVTRKLESGPGPEHMSFSKDEQEIFVTNPRAGKVAVVSVATGKLINQYSIGKAVHGLDIGDDGKTLYVSSKKENKLVALDTITGMKRELALSPAPYHLNTIKGTGKVYVSSRKKPIIWVVDQESMKKIGEIILPAGEGHQMVVVD
ncbi:MAG: YncE family protein [Gammaproteobacteria bacterium]|nr:YncE family protein [Gammaproteobacteria bacterium]